MLQDRFGIKKQTLLSKTLLCLLIYISLSCKTCKMPLPFNLWILLFLWRRVNHLLCSTLHPNIVVLVFQKNFNLVIWSTLSFLCLCISVCVSTNDMRSLPRALHKTQGEASFLLYAFIQQTFVEHKLNAE